MGSTSNGTNGVKHGLSDRYEIRQLSESHIPWATAIAMHSNIFCSPVWPLIYPKDKTQRCYDGMKAADYLVRHQINSGMSFGVFDKEYKYKRPESAATQGKLYWDENADNAANFTAEEMLEQMDFPLCSVALAYDGVNPLDMAQIEPLISLLPAFGMLYHLLHERDPRDETALKVETPHFRLMRNATSTRADYEGQHLMKNLAHYLMRTAAEKGYREIQIECAHDAVNHVWNNPPAPFKGQTLCDVDMATYTEKAEDGSEVNPFVPSTQRCTKVVVTLS